ncbi:hypothetical protein ACIRPJ_33330 [Streptomyces asoensis]|uniref:effector-associated constant component EACC1 n=1 Tax=Streptomyces asoensis TaxID=249586 RepID=UPI0016761145|nr:hypothetical protein [Streptomyces asoensis]
MGEVEGLGEGMRIRIETTADEGQGALSDLYKWLRLDADVRRQATMEMVPCGKPGVTMGTVEVIDMFLSQGFSALNLAMSYAAWRAARPAAPPITITVTATGQPLTVDDASQETIRRIVEALQAASAADQAERQVEAGDEAGTSP